MKSFLKIWLVVALLATARDGRSQGFMNLDFERADVSGDSPGVVPATNAFPYWAISVSLVTYNDVALDGQAIDLVGTNFFIPAIQGNYSAYLQGGSQFDPDHTGASIMQTAQIPASAQSITYWGGALQATFDGQALAFNAVGSGSGYTIWQANIAAYAGETGQLEFAAPWQTSGLLDNILFSANAVPEPGVLGLFALGAAVLTWRRKPM